MITKKKKSKRVTKEEFAKIQQDLYAQSSKIWRDEILSDRRQLSL